MSHICSTHLVALRFSIICGVGSLLWLLKGLGDLRNFHRLSRLLGRRGVVYSLLYHSLRGSPCTSRRRHDRAVSDTVCPGMKDAGPDERLMQDESWKAKVRLWEEMRL